MKMLVKTLGERFGGWSAICALSAKIALGIALIVLPILAVWPFGGPYTPRVEVDDEAGVLHLQVDAVRDALEQVTFRRDVDLVALTLDVPYESNFDSAVHDYATQKHPEWFEPDRRTVVLAVSPSGRWVGCYFYGRLSGLSSNWKAMSAIQEAGKDALRAGDWTGGFEAAARESASLIGRPVTTFQPYMWVGLIVLAGVAWLSVLTWIARSGMSAFERACRHRDRVAREYEGVRLKARMVPRDENHCAQVLKRFDRLDGTRAELSRAFAEFGSPRGAQWWTREMRSGARDLEKRAADLESVDSAVANASALFSRSAGWETAWNNEQGLLREDLTSFDALCIRATRSRLSVDRSRLDTEIYVSQVWVRKQMRVLDQMTAELSAGELQPAEALDRLDSLSSEIRSKAEQFAVYAISCDRSRRAADRSRVLDEKMQEWQRSRSGRYRYSGAWSLDEVEGSYDPSSTIRTNPCSPGIDDSDAEVPDDQPAPVPNAVALLSLPIAGLVEAYKEASMWTPSSSSSWNYDSGGGGFSGGDGGGGSSSHF